MHVGISACWDAGGYVARYAVGDIPYVRVKLVVKEPTLWSPTEKQTSATERSVLRSSAAARSRRRVSRYARGRLAEGAAELAAEVGAGKSGSAGHVVDVDVLRISGVGQVLPTQQVPRGRDEGHGRPARVRRAHCPAKLRSAAT